MDGWSWTPPADRRGRHARPAGAGCATRRWSPLQGSDIIDEVHNAVDGAFNALLKTLKSRPPHCEVHFATTESSQVR
jgi:hypothetical protein